MWGSNSCHACICYVQKSQMHTVPTPFLNYVNPNIKRKNKPLKLIIFTRKFYVSLINSAEILNWKKLTKSCRWITERIYLHHLDKQFGLACSSVSVVRICCKIWFESHGRQKRLSQRPFRVFWQLLFFFFAQQQVIRNDRITATGDTVMKILKCVSEIKMKVEFKGLSDPTHKHQVKGIFTRGGRWCLTLHSCPTCLLICNLTHFCIIGIPAGII